MSSALAGFVTQQAERQREVIKVQRWKENEVRRGDFLLRCDDEAHSQLHFNRPIRGGLSGGWNVTWPRHWSRWEVADASVLTSGSGSTVSQSHFLGDVFSVFAAELMSLIKTSVLLFYL